MTCRSTTPAKPSPLDFPAMVETRGFVVLYRREMSNACPGCGGSNWIVRRSTAECAFCHTALPLAEPVDPDNNDFLAQERN